MEYLGLSVPVVSLVLDLLAVHLFVFIVSFIVAGMSFLRLAVISRMNSFMLSFSRSLTSTMMESLRSFIMSIIWSFQFVDLSNSESRVMSSWVSKIAVLFGPLSWIVDYLRNGCGPLPEPRPPIPPSYLA